jgi:hypothetical protein
VQTLDTVVLASCRTITSCSRAVDLKRATQWIRAATRFNEKYGSSHLHTTCRIHYARVLLFSGQWTLAEAELIAALSVGRFVEPSCTPRHSRCSDLRVTQGRVSTAEQLIAGYEQHAVVVPVLAAIRAVQGQQEVAEWLCDDAWTASRRTHSRRPSCGGCSWRSNWHAASLKRPSPTQRRCPRQPHS